ncbi:venom phosphodiesterase 2-like isoform X2 [Panulirus ornatus]
MMMVRLTLAASVVPHAPPHLSDHLDPTSCPPTYHQHPLILVSVDGFRAEYLSRGMTPTIQALASKGTRAPYMKPSFPTITFPNHYTLVTGMYPPSHGIIANKFYDPVFQSEFRIGRKESFQPRWWGGEPIWKTVETQGKKAATFFWPGSEVDGNQPSYWNYYNESIPFEYRVDKVLSWLDLPSETRPSFITLYMHEPDNIGHDFGPNSPELEKVLVRVDSFVKRLVEGLQARNLVSCVNLLVVADHGMAEAGQQRMINLNDYIPNFTNITRFWDGAFGRFTPKDGSEATKYEMMKALSCKQPELRVYERELLPIRWHMGTQQRVENIVVDLDAGFSVGGDDSFQADNGEHGYDNYFPVMNALFVAHGPDFRRNLEVEAFQNIELYNLMCHLLDVKPAPNNGTWGALHHLLNNAPPSPLAPYQILPPYVGIPSGNELKKRLMEAQCEGDTPELDKWIDVLKDTHKKVSGFIATHLPWDIPQNQEDSSILLIQPDFITDFTTRRDFAQLPYLISNAVPFTHQLTQRWQELKNFISKWANLYGALNVIAGPVFDYDANSFADDLDKVSQTTGLVVPTHMFLVASRCSVWVDHLADCPHDQVDSLAFVYPQYLPITNCLNAARYAQEFSAKVQDVEKITGLKFYPSMHYYDQVRLQVRIHSNIWGYETWWNRLHN